MKMRVRAEQHARRQYHSREVKLAQIYDVLAEWLELRPDQKERLMRMEYSLEEELIRPVPGAHDRIQQVRDKGRRVVYASDMYLPASFLQEQLQRHGFWRDEDKCYISCEFGRTKSTGELFKDILSGESMLPSEVEHWGDNPVSDVRGAERSGIAVRHLPQGNLNRFETILESFAGETQGLSSVMAGASRLSRLAFSNHEKHNHDISVVAAGVAGPVLTAFVLWILRRASDLGVKRIYFLSRDGEILLDIAREMAAALGIEIECRYLYGSRQAWHLPSIIDEIREPDLEWILEPTRFLSVRTALKRVELAPEAIETELNRAGLHASKWDRDLAEIERVWLRNVILMPSVQARVLERAMQARTAALEYLQQEGLYDPIKAAIVDLGWRGRLMRSLSSLLGNSGGKLPIPLFFGLVADAHGEDLAERETYLFEADRMYGLDFCKSHPRFWNLLEAFCAGCEGTVTGYVRRNDTVVVNLQSPDNRMVINWGLPVLRKTVSTFVQHVAEGLTHVEPWADLRPATRALLAEFWERPTLSEALAWGAYPYEDDQTGSHWEHLAMPVSGSNVGRALYDRREWRRHRPIWMAGSIVMSPIQVRLVLTFLLRSRGVWLFFRGAVLGVGIQAGRLFSSKGNQGSS